MPPRKFATTALIRLPVMNAHTASAFARRLLAQYRIHRGSLRGTKVAARATALTHGADDLAAALAAEQAVATGREAAAALDPTVDASWAALVLVLEGWAKLKARDEGVGAQAVLDDVFPDRLAFTQEKYPQQWSEANARIAKLSARREGRSTHAVFVEENHRCIRAAVVIEEIRERHAEFGRALGLEDGTEAPEANDVRGPYEAVLDAAREYIAAVLQLDRTDLKEPDSVRHELLYVIEEFESQAKRGPREDPPEEPATEPKG